MKQITNIEYEKYQQYLSDKLHGRILTPGAIRFICEANGYDAARIGWHFLELLPTALAGRSPDADELPGGASCKYWLCAESEAELNEFSDMFWGFHDFRIERIEYSAAADRIDVLLEYDTHDIRILLRLLGSVAMNFVPGQDYAANWLMGASMGIGATGQIVWVGADDAVDIKAPPADALWVSGNKLHYALLGDDGRPREIPEEILHQERHALNYITGEYDITEKDFHPRYLSAMK